MQKHSKTSVHINMIKSTLLLFDIRYLNLLSLFLCYFLPTSVWIGMLIERREN